MDSSSIRSATVGSYNIKINAAPTTPIAGSWRQEVGDAEQRQTGGGPTEQPASPSRRRQPRGSGAKSPPPPPRQRPLWLKPNRNVGFLPQPQLLPRRPRPNLGPQPPSAGRLPCPGADGLTARPHTTTSARNCGASASFPACWWWFSSPFPSCCRPAHEAGTGSWFGRNSTTACW